MTRGKVGEFVPWGTGRKNSPGWIENENGCHIWIGNRTKTGYPRVIWEGSCRPTHRVRYELEIGPIPEGAQLDHFACDNGRGGCCNPHHCRPVTPRENSLRGNTVTSANAAKTHCLHGHPLSGDNLIQNQLKRGFRKCRTCNNARLRRLYQRKKLGSRVPERA